ncbi:MAG: zf-HC2 domain-containing protein [Ignavibacteriales bacterium]|nr:zf-HC2 domain-containing protein [Ignavibacteriales bacterium]
MNECRKIEPLIYLYRKGELSADENQKVIEHTKNCSQCRDIIEQLHSIDVALSPVRETTPDMSDDISLVNEMINRIVKTNGRNAVSKRKSLNLDVIFGWLKPALSIMVLSATLLFVTQQSRDARKISDLETHLRTTKRNTGSDISYTNSDARNILGIVTPKVKEGFSSSLNNAGISLDPMRMIGSELLELFKKQNGLFDYLSSRYPNLSEVNIEDGINDRERKILATEGKALMKDLEQLTQEGDK